MKFTKIALAALTAVSLAACSSEQASSTSASSASSAAEDVVTTGSYTFYNGTGSAIKELYIYKTGDEKSENLLTEDLADDASVEIAVGPVDEAEASDYHMTVEYVDEDGNNVIVFESLNLEEATLYLKSSSDVESGATPFFVSGSYTIHNVSGEAVTELYIYETDGDKGDNLLTEDLAADADLADPIEISVSAAAAAAGYTMTVEFVTESGADCVTFTNLHLEVADLYLKSAADVENGATPFLNN